MLQPLLDQVLLPQRLAQGLARDVRKIADSAVAMVALGQQIRPLAQSLAETIEHAAGTLDAVNHDIARLRASLEPMSEDLDRIRATFAATAEELEKLREDLRPDLAGVRAATERLDSSVRLQVESVEKLDASVGGVGDLLAGRLSMLRDLLGSLVKDANEMREVVEPLQDATERVGRIAQRMPGPGRKR